MLLQIYVCYGTTFFVLVLFVWHLNFLGSQGIDCWIPPQIKRVLLQFCIWCPACLGGILYIDEACAAAICWRWDQKGSVSKLHVEGLHVHALHGWGQSRLACPTPLWLHSRHLSQCMERIHGSRMWLTTKPPKFFINTVPFDWYSLIRWDLHNEWELSCSLAPLTYPLMMMVMHALLLRRLLLMWPW
jgi:hypothetical protein